jgi:hypothetical protein
MGAISPAVPEWCALPLGPAITTHSNGGNSWVDNWQHGSSHGALGNVSDGYVTGDFGSCDTIHFRHNQHWMVDHAGDNGQYPTSCGSWLRPDRTFTAAGGKVVVEGEVAGPIATTHGQDGLSDSWAELIISTAPRASSLRKNGTYAYEAFPGAYTVGVRIATTDRRPITALYNNGSAFAGGPDRLWEINQNGGEVRFEEGGGPYSSAAHDSSYRVCDSADDPDTLCRNLFRWELYKVSGEYVQDLYVNGLLYYRAGIVGAALDNILNGPFYVYFAEFSYRIHTNAVVRFHWDRIAVNP